jgi:mycothiol synthase
MNQRPFSGETDIQRMIALSQVRPDDNVHVIDLPYRLSSWSLDDPDNVALWADSHGQLLAWAIMQTPFWTIDYVIHPGVEQTLHRQILSWADGRARQSLNKPAGRPSWYVTAFTDQTERIRDLEAAGFANQADVGQDSWTKVLMRRQAGRLVTEGTLPAGFTIRPLAGENEIDGYVDLHCEVFESKNMTAGWRARTLLSPEYRPETDMVAVAPDGRLAGFCIGWFGRRGGEWAGQIEPLGVRRKYRRLGLGGALLSETLRRLYKNGAEDVYVETDNYRNAALGTYEAVGFQVLRDIVIYRKDFSDNQTRRGE